MNSSETPELEIKTIELTDKEIFIRIWTEPRVVFRYLHEFHYDKYTYLLLFLAAVTNGFTRAATNHTGRNMAFPAVVIMAIVFGGIFGVMTYYIYAAMASWTGKWVGGKADTKSLLRVFAHAMFPVALALVVVCAQISVFGEDMFRDEINIENYDAAHTAFYFVAALIEFSLGIWALCISVVGVSEIQQISLGRAILR
jgi:hypothetical protein